MIYVYFPTFLSSQEFVFILRLDREANAALETLGAPLKN